jgi:GMP synthase-like glutamine amidotransferase
VRIRFLLHVPFEGPAAIANWATARGYPCASTRLFAGEPAPDPAAFDMLVILGGPMSVHDTAVIPWLGAEKKLIGQALSSGKRICGICLGAQLLAEALGGQVVRNKHKEIGWHPIEFLDADSHFRQVLPTRVDAFHWHGETFTIPAGAIRLARSEACENQAFAHGDRVLALQFHPEATADGIRQLARHCGDELVPGPFIQSAEQMLAGSDRIGPANDLLFRLLDRLCETRETP